MTDRRAWAVVASFPPHPRNVRHARRMAAAALAAWGVPELTDTAETVVSELVTNAFRYGSGPVDLTLALAGRSLRVSVTDEGPELPSSRAPGCEEAGGRGLWIVELLSDRWEVTVHLTGKTVSCVLPVPPRGHGPEEDDAGGGAAGAVGARGDAAEAEGAAVEAGPAGGAAEPGAPASAASVTG